MIAKLQSWNLCTRRKLKQSQKITGLFPFSLCFQRDSWKNNPQPNTGILDKNNILYKYQSGFRKHHSTDTGLSYLTWLGFEEGLLTGMVLIDLQKAFDTIDHSILLEKMSCLGFSGKTITWYTSYLTNKSFIVNVGKEFSSPCKLSCGVPQASILGPLLFLLYVNDMPQAVNSEVLLYADDTCLIYMGENTQKIEEQLNSDFTSLCEWFIDNKLSVHFGEEKTKSVLFGTKRQLKDQRVLNLKYGDIEIKHHSRVTYLGQYFIRGAYGCKSIKHSKQQTQISLP